jgi:hypothetical protein
MYITDHAYERLYSKYPHAGYDDIVKALSEAVSVSVEVVTAITARANPREVNSLYCAHPDYQGIFVLDASEPKLITFLRLGNLQWAHLALEAEPVLAEESDLEPVEPKIRQHEKRAAFQARLVAWRARTGWLPQPDTLYRSVSGRIFIGEVNPLGATKVYFTSRSGGCVINGCKIPGATTRVESWEPERLRAEVDKAHADNAFVVRP